MTIDHRTLPDIEWASSPGPLRVGDYVRIGDRVWLASEDLHDVRLSVDDLRVIPHVRPLEVPEETTIASLDELEVCTARSEYSDLVLYVAADVVVNKDHGWLETIASCVGVDDECDVIRNIAFWSKDDAR